MNDLYDRIRPADEILDEETAARVWSRVTGEALEPSGVTPQDESASVLRLSTRVRESPRRRLAGWSAAAAVVVGVAGLVGVVATRSEPIDPADTSVASDPVPEPDIAPTALPETDPVAPEVTAAEAEELGDDLSTGTKFAVADDPPDGWAIESMRAERAGSMFGEARWAQVGPDGSVAGIISIRPPILLSAEDIAQSSSGEFDDTVRGVPADEWTVSIDNGSSVQRNGIAWIEESLQMQVSAVGTTADLVRPVAEALVLDVESRTVTLPDSFGLVPATDLDFADDNAVRTTLFMQPEWSDSHGIGISSWPNTFGFGLDRLVGTTADWQPIQIDDIAALGARTPDGNLIGLSWLDGDMYITLSNSLVTTDDEVFDVVRGLRFTDAEQFRATGQSIADRINADIADWTVFDQVATSDGIAVSIRTKPGGTGAHALCIDVPIFDCSLIQSEGGSVDGFESYGAAGFDLGDRRIGVAWVSSDIDAATIEPSLHSSDSLNPFTDLLLDETTATVLADTTTDVGRFVLVDIPDGERPPAIRFESGDQLGPQIDLTPMPDGPFDF